jgi:hypothetical protein
MFIYSNFFLLTRKYQTNKNKQKQTKTNKKQTKNKQKTNKTNKKQTKNKQKANKNNSINKQT